MDILELLGHIGKTEEKDKISYSAGVVMALSLRDIGFEEIRYEDYIDGMKSVFEKSAEKISPKRSIEIFNNYVALLQEELKVKNAEIGKAFLEKNAKKEGIVTLSSGLQYEVLVEGKGKTPKITDTVNVIYEGYLLNKDVFDSTKETGAQKMKVLQTLTGWREALQLMPEGSRWKIYVPHDLAYGHIGAPPMIQPNATLVFIIELLNIE
ncbi:FKBP-type peptidyl-prolyl cis-trans isomerase FklB [Flavobacterium sp. 90]|uniref:FKBP-type peptidyl-prolyl cis-trans isomerase n=1 Tax=unclassified Flavobacterium TaxID=196869 RepID=UPI000EB1E7A0|nr:MULTISPECIES: FKBP-type peptidyl-prolyl cis-trans isomerase [unclassified Flavobacterium]RKR11709.1 FKBP-type peptidyl-prolyl cis-trans isomerase FklB [Flavobacterium sp. 81]TCK55485.1 FKBP-type peptidyl-prolyl cis-trans isomerase FklB [Flavobacterium sp. 90]